MSQNPSADSWKTSEQVNIYLNEARAALPLASEQLQVMKYVIAQALPQGITTFLDLGCGDGALGRTLLQRYPDAKGVFLDFSPPMLEALKPQIDLEQHTVILGDLSQPRWQDHLPNKAQFDVIVSGYAIHHLTDARKQALFQEIYTLLKPGGVFINVDHIESPTDWLEGVFLEAFIDGIYHQEQSKQNGRTREAIAKEFEDEIDDGDILARVETQCDWLRHIGFQDVDCYMKIYALAVFGGVRPQADVS